MLTKLTPAQTAILLVLLLFALFAFGPALGL